jgi:DNA (cytosine-5)-methyltransferase 1
MIGFRDFGIRFDFPDIPDKKPVIADILERDVPEKYTLTDHLWQYLQDYADKHHRKGNGFGFGLVDLNSCSRTLSARYYKDGSEILIPQEGKNPRRLTPRECARLQGFPDSFIIPFRYAGIHTVWKFGRCSAYGNTRKTGGKISQIIRVIIQGEETKEACPS